MSNMFDPRHPHEPEEAPLIDNEGRCLVCYRHEADKKIALAIKHLSRTTKHANDLGDLLAKREEELELLRAKVDEAVLRSSWAACPFCGFLNRPYDQKPLADDHKESCPWRPVFSALSDNQEG